MSTETDQEHTVQEWEYEISASYSKWPNDKTLTQFGDEGWELVAIIPGQDAATWVLYFKRPKQ
jgi:hypothetical protein